MSINKPLNPSVGDIWVDQARGMLYIWNGNKWAFLINEEINPGWLRVWKKETTM